MEKMDKTVKTVVNQKLPALKNLLSKNKNEVKALDAEGNELDDLDLEENIQVPKKKFQLSRIHIIVIIGLAAIFLLPDDEETVAPPVQKPKVVSKRTTFKPKVNKENKAPVQAEEKIIAKEPEPQKAKEITEPVADIPVESETPSKEKPLEVADSSPKNELDQKVDEEFKKIEQSAKVNLDELKKNESDEADKIEESIEDKIVDVPVKNEAVKELEDLDTSSEVSKNNSSENEPEPEVEEVDLSALADESQRPNTADESDQVESERVEDDKVTSNNEVPAKPEEIIPQKEMQSDISTEITKKLLEDLEIRLKEEKTVQKTISVIKPTSAPSYEVGGRGLSYNCKDKHWACIEQAEYKKCRHNYSWNKNEGIPLECYPVAFLETEYDCALVQQEKIDSIGDTDFCEL